MRKIELSHEIEKKHLKYFEENILNDLLKSRRKHYEYKTKEIRLLKEDPNVFKKKFQKQHFQFIGFVKNRYKHFAIGRKYKLEELNEEIQKKFPLIKRMIELNHPSLKQSYKDYLYQLFGYEKFKVKDLYHYIKLKAQIIVDEERYNEKVYYEMVRILKTNYPKRKKEINEVFPKDRHLKASECKAAFRELRRCDITMDNFKQHKIFGKEWNDYAFIMESGLRVCPYCNRQYITPIYSDNGKMRADIDHFLPKSKFPYFSMSLYNLVPVCKSCNQSLKGDREFSFDSISPYEDHISDYFKFRANIRNYEITIKILGTNPEIMKHIDIFKIETLYNYHRGQVKEMITKRISYPDEYIQRLYKDNAHYFNSVNDVKQLIIGFIDDKSKLNDEAFLKLRRDLAEQLGFLSTTGNDHLITQLKKIIEDGSKVKV
ncbi:HNH endonuclease domain-containing protein [Metabacillus bambusae]|uniref:HNH endonuclease n=1 Tax=Metabacillus bambusae TaxID=2795218 RepID=A0ABS3NAG0_9BACI|nr:HNH endonuclease domain-containing protein [Metabacillus bambusae]MBO1515173.1 HNH endonuclease [Metabacillus bambusae]